MDSFDLYPELTIDLRHLRYFTVVAQHLHFGRAALALNISQPPLSRQIRELEERLGVTLFERRSGGIRLTAAGEVLLNESRRILESVALSFRLVRGASEKLPDSESVVREAIRALDRKAS